MTANKVQIAENDPSVINRLDTGMSCTRVCTFQQCILGYSKPKRTSNSMVVQGTDNASSRPFRCNIHTTVAQHCDLYLTTQTLLVGTEVNNISKHAKIDYTSTQHRM